jgi:hypothetical protein
MTAISVVASDGRLAGTSTGHGDMKVFEFFCQWFTKRDRGREVGSVIGWR